MSAAGRYFAATRTEHSCCWGASVCDRSKPMMIIGEHYQNEYEMLCECLSMEEAEAIAAALNKTQGAET